MKEEEKPIACNHENTNTTDALKIDANKKNGKSLFGGRREIKKPRTPPAMVMLMLRTIQNRICQQKGGSSTNSLPLMSVMQFFRTYTEHKAADAD